MAAPGRAATVVIAQPDEARLALLGRIVSATGHRAVPLGACSPPEVVEATVEAPANALIVDMADLSLDELDAILQALEARRFPTQVVALTDGPASAEMARRAGAEVALARPFHKTELTDALNGLVGLAPPAAGVRDEEDQPEADQPDPEEPDPEEPDREEPEASYPPGASLDHSFTDILKMGRQV